MSVAVASASEIQRLHWYGTTDAYRQAAIIALLREANIIASQLRLSEKMPISRHDLVNIRIGAPFMSDNSGSFGSISTTNFIYAASVGNKLSYVLRNLGENDSGDAVFLQSLMKRYLAPEKQIDTNAAINLSVEFLSAAEMDVKALERDCTLQVVVRRVPGGFIPIYRVRWLRPYASPAQGGGTEDHGLEPVASVEVLAPERRLLQMHIEKPRYITRPALAVPNRRKLLQQTEDPLLRDMWFTTDAYEREAQKLLLEQINSSCAHLGLTEDFPIRAQDVVKASMETPFISDRLGRFGQISSKAYIYGAASGNKFSWIAQNIEDEGWYFHLLRERLATPKSAVDPHAAYVLATNWLAALSIDVQAMERDNEVSVSFWDLGTSFVPIYKIKWHKPGNSLDYAAMVEVVVPDRSFRLLAVEKSQYIKGNPLTVAHREELLKAQRPARPEAARR